jgi:putative MATE family efflux protein
MKIIGLENIINGILSYFLVFGVLGFPEMGVQGSAAGTAIVRVISLFLSLGGLLMGWYCLKIKIKHIIPLKFDMLSKIMNISWPAIAENFLYSAAYLTFLRIISSLGTTAIAVDTILANAEYFAYMSGMSFATAASIAVGQSLGENNKERAKILAWEATKLGMWVMGIMGAIFFILPYWVLRLFTTDKEVLGIAVLVLMITSPIEPIQGLMLALKGALQGAGDTRTTMKISTIGMWLIRIPCAYLLAITLGAGILGAWGAMCLHIGIIALLFLRRFRSNQWTEIKV